MTLLEHIRECDERVEFTPSDYGTQPGSIGRAQAWIPYTGPLPKEAIARWKGSPWRPFANPGRRGSW